MEDLWLEEYKGKYSTPTVVKLPLLIRFIYNKTFSGLKSHKQIKSIPFGKTNAYQAYIKSDPKETNDPLAYWNSLYLSQPNLTQFT